MYKDIGKKAFLNYVQMLDGLIIFGAGRNFPKTLELLEEKNLSEKVICVWDNDENKWGKKVAIFEREVNIEKPKSLKFIDCEGVVILITCSNYLPILRQLESLGALENSIVCCYVEMGKASYEEKLLEKVVPNELRVSKWPIIPKTIHYCWFGEAPIPDEYKIYMETWKKFCPDYEIKEWNELNYDITKHEFMRQAYSNRKWSFVSDYARLDIIYQHGGIYLDTDVELLQPIDDLLYQEAYMGFEGENCIATGLGFGARPGHPIIKELRDYYHQIKFPDKLEELAKIACPIIQTEILETMGLIRNGEYQRWENITFYPEKVLTGMNVINRKIVLAPYTKSIHHYAGSWLK